MDSDVSNISKKEGKCSECGEEGMVYYYKGNYYCREHFDKYTQHLAPFEEVFD